MSCTPCQVLGIETGLVEKGLSPKVGQHCTTIVADKYIPLKILCRRRRSKLFGEHPQDEY